MLSEIGTITRLQGKMATVLVRRNSACGHCPSRWSCDSFDGNLRQVDVSNPIGARVGQQVKIGISPKAVVKASLLLYLIPVFALLTGAFLGSTLFPQQREIGAIAVGIGSFIGFFFVPRVFGKHLRSRVSYLPRVTEILIDPSEKNDRLATPETWEWEVKQCL